MKNNVYLAKVITKLLISSILYITSRYISYPSDV